MGLLRVKVLSGAELSTYFEFCKGLYWENLEVVKNFAGADTKKAKYYPEDRDHVLEFPEKVAHFEVFADEF